MCCTSTRLNCDYYYSSIQRGSSAKKKKKARDNRERCHVDIGTISVWHGWSHRVCHPIYVSHVIQFDCATNNEYTAFHTKRDVWFRMSSWFSHSRQTHNGTRAQIVTSIGHRCSIHTRCRITIVISADFVVVVVAAADFNDSGDGEKSHRSLIFAGLLVTERVESCNNVSSFYRINSSDMEKSHTHETRLKQTNTSEWHSDDNATVSQTVWPCEQPANTITKRNISQSTSSACGHRAVVSCCSVTSPPNRQTTVETQTTKYFANSCSLPFLCTELIMNYLLFQNK